MSEETTSYLDAKITFIELFPIVIDCYMCGVESRHGWGVPIVNGSIVANCYEGEEWAGQAVCRLCYLKHTLASDLYETYLWERRQSNV